MKQKVVTSVLAAEEDDWDREDAYDVYFLDPYPGEPEIAPHLRSIFDAGEYSVRRVELARTHRVVVVHAAYKGSVRMSDQRSLRRHFRSLLRRVGLRLRGDELVVTQRGKRVMVALLWKDSPVDPRPTAEELEAQYDPIP